jgi:hypothetical protein
VGRGVAPDHWVELPWVALRSQQSQGERVIVTHTVTVFSTTKIHDPKCGPRTRDSTNVYPEAGRGCTEGHRKDAGHGVFRAWESEHVGETWAPGASPTPSCSVGAVSATAQPVSSDVSFYPLEIYRLSRLNCPCSSTGTTKSTTNYTSLY